MVMGLLTSMSPFGRRRSVRCEGPPAGPPPVKPQDEQQPQFEMFSKEWQQLSQQDNFDGFRLEAMNSVNKYMQAAHTIFLGTQLRPDGYIYQFGPQFASESG